MKTISYTKMRDELTDVLEMLRNGEDITVTQRGRPDIVLSAKTTHISAPKGEWRKVGETVRRRNGVVEHVTTMKRESHGVEKITKNGISFDEAKKKTADKHAGIIKALEDK